MLSRLKYFWIAMVIVVIGICVGYGLDTYTNGEIPLLSPLGIPGFSSPQKQVIGFLPYWLLSSAQDDYSPYFTTLTYFGLTIDNDGHILKMINKTETEPGWHSLNIGKVDRFILAAKTKKMTLSLLVFAAKEDSIYAIISNPSQNAQNLVSDVVPLMQQYGFTDLNVDIESIATASDSAKQQFTRFIDNVNRQLKSQGKYTLTVEITASDAIKNKLISVPDLSTIADHVVIMAYDYHYLGSRVTGPVAPLSGGGTTYEYDVETAIDAALTYLPSHKIVLGIPSYGYEWETLSAATSSATLPGSGLTASVVRVQKVLNACTNCQQVDDAITNEAVIIYPDETTHTFHQIFYPNGQSTTGKIKLASEKKLGGIAVWALGYENDTILEPLKGYRP